MDQHRVDLRVGDRLVVGGDLLLGVDPRPPGARALVEELDRAAGALLPARDRVRRPAGGRDVGSDQHRIWTLFFRGMLCPVCAFASPRRRPAPPHRWSADGTVQLAPGPGPAARSSCCGSRTPTASARRRRTSSRSSRPCAGSASTGTATPSSSPSAGERHAEVVEQLIAGGHAYRSTAGAEQVKAFKEAHGNAGFRGERRGRGRRPAADARRGRDRRARRHPRRERFEHRLMDDLVIARADGTPVYHLAVVVDDLDAGITHVVRGADHYSNTPKQMRILEAMGAEIRSTPTCRCCTAPTARSSPSATAPPPCRSCATPATCPRPSATTSRCSAGATTRRRPSTTTEELQQRFSLERVSKSPAVFDEKKLRWMNGHYVRELPVEELTRRLETFTGRSGLGEAVAISREKFQTLAEFWPLVGLPLRRPGRRPEAAREVARARRRRRRCWRRPATALAAIEGPWTVEDVEAALTRRRRAGGRQAGQALPAAAGRAGGNDRVAGYLRDGCGARAGRDARAVERRDVGLNRPSTDADRG